MKRQLVTICLILIMLCVSLLITACGSPKPTTNVPPPPPQTPYDKAVAYLDNARATGREVHDDYMRYHSARIASIQADKTLTAKQRYTAIKKETDQATAVNEAYGKSLTYEDDAGKVLLTLNPTTFTGAPIKQILTVTQSLAGLFNDPQFINIGDAAFRNILSAAQAAIAILIGILEAQIGPIEEVWAGKGYVLLWI